MIQSNVANSAVLTSENNRSLAVDYYITNGLCLTDGAEQTRTYGVLAKLSVDGKYTESAQIDDVSSSEQVVKDLVDLLAKNGVTPIALSDVVNDYVTI